MEKKVKAVCPNCGYKLDKIEENWVGDDVEIYESYAMDEDGKVRPIKTEIAQANIDPDTFIYVCPHCYKEIVLEKPYDVGGDSKKTDKEIIADFLSGKTKGKPEGSKI